MLGSVWQRIMPRACPRPIFFITKLQIFKRRELKREFVGQGKPLQADTIDALERIIQEAEANQDEKGAWSRRDRAKDE